MSASMFSLSRLVPEFSELFNGNIGSAHGLSAFIVSFLILLTIVFLSFAFRKFIQAKKHIEFYEELLKGVSQSDLARKQRDITKKALDHKVYGKRWKEFDETLVLSTDGERLYNTLDAEHFFNTTTLAQGLTENRLLAAVPGFLTAIGVIGTFAGLQMGLSSLELAQDSGVEVLQRGIGNIISGASIAFLTSVWGVATSVLFNFVEKALERGIRKKIGNLQNHIDYLYPRINPEQSLVTIADLNRSSNEALQGLAEKIGDRLQEALVQTSDSIRSGLVESLNQILLPAVESLVENAQTGSQQAFDSLLNKFLDGVGEAGTSQKEMMLDASNDVRNAVSDLGQQMTTFLTQMDEQSRRSDSEARERQKYLEEQLQAVGAEHQARENEIGQNFQAMFGKLVEQLGAQQTESDQREQQRADLLQEQLNLLSSRNQEVVTGIGQTVTAQLDNQQKRDDERQQHFSESMAQFDSVQHSLMDRMSELIGSQERSFSAIQTKLTELLSQFDIVALSHSNAGKEVSQSAKEMQSVSNQLGMLSVNIKQAAENLGENVSSAAKSTMTLSEENRLITEELKEAISSYQELRVDMSQLVNELSTTTERAQGGFDTVHKHLDAFQQAIRTHIVDLESQLQNLLIGYAEQVQNQTKDRLLTWHDETDKYLNQVTRAAQAMANVVNEMETKCSVA